jgi:hypothetical protein
MVTTYRPLLSAEYELSTNPSLDNQHRSISGPEIGIGKGAAAFAHGLRTSCIVSRRICGNSSTILVYGSARLLDAS